MSRRIGTARTPSAASPGRRLSGTGGDGYYAGDGDKIVILVDNVRDDNYNDLNNSQGLSYIAGFFSSTINTLLDRNVMTVDSFDWLHRTTANPPNEPVAGNNCTSKPARPFLYEGVFAHEYQHLLESYVSPAETTWVNEGLSDFAIAATGYVDPKTPITETGFDSHLQCFLGWLGVATPANPNPRPTSGPENSLTSWEDQGPGEILCDYGAAFSFMLWLSDHYGCSFMSALHSEPTDGLPGLQKVLDARMTGKTAQEVIHLWAAAVAVDKSLDSGANLRWPVSGGVAPDFEHELGDPLGDARGVLDPRRAAERLRLRPAPRRRGPDAVCKTAHLAPVQGCDGIRAAPDGVDHRRQPAAPAGERCVLRRSPRQHGQRDGT